jgi:hypothetical protein
MGCHDNPFEFLFFFLLVAGKEPPHHLPYEKLVSKQNKPKTQRLNNHRIERKTERKRQAEKKITAA